MKIFVALSALLAVVASDADPWTGYGLGTPYALGGAVKTITPLQAPLVSRRYAAGPLLSTRTHVRALPAVHLAKSNVYAAPVVAHAPALAPVAPIVAPAPALARVAPALAPVAPAAVSTASIVNAPAAPISSQHHAQDEFGNYEYGYSNPNSAKHESGNAQTGVSGSYSYVDSYGLPQQVSYVADAFGFRTTAATNQPIALAHGPAHALLQRHRRSLGYGYAGLPLAHAHAARQVISVGSGLPAPLVNAPALATSGYGYGYAAPSAYGYGYAAPHAAVGVSSPHAAREGLLETVQLNPGHATAYRVY